MIFLDTGYLLALFDPADELRMRAMNWSGALREPCLVTEYVLWECVNAFSHVPCHAGAGHTARARL
jgi:predicted nucleic acid-binding protein